jgi:hypothetical protein
MATEGLGPEHRNKCGHEGCECLIGPMDHFCSEYCAKSSSADISGTLPGGKPHSGACKCGHAECEERRKAA